MRKSTKILVPGLVMILLLITSCASSKVSALRPELAAALQAVEQAEQVGAETYAPLELRNARQKLDQAQAFLDDKEHEKAKMWIERATVDAELAEAKALSSKAQKAVDELQVTIQTLRDEIERNRNQNDK